MSRLKFPKIEQGLKIIISSRSTDKINTLIDKYKLRSSITIEKEYENHLHIVTARIDNYCGSRQMISELDVDGEVWVTESYVHKYYRTHDHMAKQFFSHNISLAGDVVFKTGLSTAYETISNFVESILFQADTEVSRELLKIKDSVLFRSIIKEATYQYYDFSKTSPSIRGRSLDRLFLWINVLMSKLNFWKSPLRSLKDITLSALMRMMK